ncbi:MAG: hypothetical protein IPH12_14595 [Saprospirales bacterium]|nr:hypothetical protein [Saprospirales bacterium]
MNTSFLFRRRTRQATTILLLLFAVGTMAAARQQVLLWWAAQAAWVALGYLLLAMVLLVFNRTRLMFVCLGCSAAICLFFNEIQSKAFVPSADRRAPVSEPMDSTEHGYPTPY